MTKTKYLTEAQYGISLAADKSHEDQTNHCDQRTRHGNNKQGGCDGDFPGVGTGQLFPGTEASWYQWHSR